ncbi:MAG: hypothetical protein WC959_12405 [Kiritimatiellales bacterium]
MIVNIYFSREEIRSFFLQNGIQVIESTFGTWRKEYHNQDKWVEYPADAVIINDRQVEASKLFEKVSAARLKQLIAPRGEHMKKLIQREFKNMTR